MSEPYFNDAPGAAMQWAFDTVAKLVIFFCLVLLVACLAGGIKWAVGLWRKKK